MPKLPVVATAVIAAILCGWWAFAEVSAKRKLAPVEPMPVPRGSYQVRLDFTPERFHQLRLQEVGRMVEVRDRDVFLMDVTPQALHGIAREYWVESVTRWEGR